MSSRIAACALVWAASIEVTATANIPREPTDLPNVIVRLFRITG